jgi:hypothetical protein
MRSGSSSTSMLIAALGPSVRRRKRKVGARWSRRSQMRLASLADIRRRRNHRASGRVRVGRRALFARFAARGQRPRFFRDRILPMVVASHAKQRHYPRYAKDEKSG